MIRYLKEEEDERYFGASLLDSTNVSERTRSRSVDVHNELKGPCLAYFLERDVLGNWVSFASTDLPSGILQHTVSTVALLLTTLSRIVPVLLPDSSFRRALYQIVSSATVIAADEKSNSIISYDLSAISHALADILRALFSSLRGRPDLYPLLWTTDIHQSTTPTKFLLLEAARDLVGSSNLTGYVAREAIILAFQAMASCPEEDLVQGSVSTPELIGDFVAYLIHYSQLPDVLVSAKFSF
jgi:hypothetical protein